jgi:hypothetical protein
VKTNRPIYLDALEYADAKDYRAMKPPGNVTVCGGKPRARKNPTKRRNK